MNLRFFLPLFLFFSFSFSTASAQVNTGDSLALVDLYNSTNGPGWVNHNNWLTTAPLGSWQGVTVFNNRVSQLILNNNRLKGTIPSTLGNLGCVITIAFNNNQLIGEIPPSLASLPLIVALDLSNNQLTGPPPASFQQLTRNAFLLINSNKFTFDGLEPLVASTSTGGYFLTCTPEADIPLNQNGNTLSVSAGGSLSQNTYRWYKDDVLVATKTGDSTFTFTVPGNYSVAVSNGIITTNPDPALQVANFQLILYSVSKANVNDSLAMVDLYNATNGNAWINNTNWLTSAPLSTWYGVTLRRGRITNLTLDSNNLAGALPASIGTISRLSNLSLSHNQLSGNAPSLAGLGMLTQLDFGYNQFSGDLPAMPFPINILNLNDCHFNGSIPPSYGNLPFVRRINLYNNDLTGSIPVEIGNLMSLEQLYLNNNQLGGSIPVALGRLVQLNSLDLRNNRLTGAIPDSITRLSRLGFLYLNNNQLTGSIPDSIVKLSKLERIGLNNNQLIGKIPDSIGSLSQLYEISLNGNHLNGSLPVSLKKLSNLDEFAIQDNFFTFDGMENLPALRLHGLLTYAPQGNITLNKSGNQFSVTAGGNLSADTFTLFKNGLLYHQQLGDSVFHIIAPGQYYIAVTNKIAPLLTLRSDTIRVGGLVLADSTSSVIQTITGSDPVSIEDSVSHSLLLTVSPTAGANALNGEVDFKVIIDTSVNTYSGQPYVQRHYDIVPANNASNAMATITLYFTQQDFDNFNAAPTHGLDLPTGPADAAGIANLRVYQYHGFSTTSLPGSYSGPAIEIDPADANIVWNSNGQYWEVSFDVDGFSGFFVSSLNSALLPVKLVSFTGKLQGNSGLLQWVTANEINSSYFELQRSANGNNFNAIAAIPAAGNSNGITLNYQYTDQPKTAVVYYYRLKVTDKDDRFTYSKVIKLNYAVDNSIMSVYPNPANKSVLVNFAQTTASTSLKMIDMAGRVVKTIPIPKGATQLRLNLSGLPGGMYKLISDNGKEAVNCSLIVK